MYIFHKLKQVQLPQHTRKKGCRSVTPWLTRVLGGVGERKEADDFKEDNFGRRSNCTESYEARKMDRVRCSTASTKNAKL